MNENCFKNVEDLPLTLTANDLAMALNISRGNAYCLLRSEGFPTLKIGKRLLVPKEKFLMWIDNQGA